MNMVDTKKEALIPDKVIFGWHVILDLVNCNDNIKSAEKLKQYAKELCEVIDMVRYGETLTPYFGLDSEVTKGHSLVQLIETSSICAHFSDYYRSAHIDIFSCKEYDMAEAVAFTREFFGGAVKYMLCLDRYCR